MTTTMVNYGVTRALEDAEHAMFASACRAHVDVLVPYVGSCLSRVYPASSGALDSMRLTAPLREALRGWEAQRVAETSTAAGMWCGASVAVFVVVAVIFLFFLLHLHLRLVFVFCILYACVGMCG